MTKTFEQWFSEVDGHMVRLCGMGADDLPDYCYRDAYEDDVPARECARDAIRAARDEF